MPFKPTFTHSAATQFTLANFDSRLSYEVVNGSRSGAVITPTSASLVCTVTARSRGASFVAAASTCEYRVITQSTVLNYTQTSWWEHGYPCGATAGHNFDTSCNAVNTCAACSSYPWSQTCGHSQGNNYCTTVDNSPPSGFTVSLSRWIRTT